MAAGETMPELPDDLFDRASERLMGVDRGERTAALEALIAEHPEFASGLKQLSVELGAAARLLEDTYPDPVVAPMTHIGGHRVIRQLGEGAFGVVFLCAQERPVVRNVAIKVLRPGAGDEKTLRRFAAERQLLATLNHPAITQVFDAGEMPDGRPFFVMEYVDGPTIRSYCEQRTLSCRERLQLFTVLCRGVAHAHTRGIVHRDLKPGNVLVVDTETGPMPKIIDFGIAKALFVSEGDQGPRTDAGRVVGTPGYMSPEQAAGRVEEVDSRSDVFALGVMLYELLTRRLPWPQADQATDTEPMRPSARITTTAFGSTAPATQRRQLVAELRGDLDWITLKALARERADRYATPTALAEDIERHLRGEPVSVGPPSVAYRLRKYVRRNRTLVFSLSAAAALLVVGLVVALSYGSAARAEVADAKHEAAASSAGAAALVERLLDRANDPLLREAPQGDAGRKALIEDALSFYDRFLRDRPSDPGLRAGRCTALLSLSHVHCLLGDTKSASRTADEAGEEATQLLVADPASLRNHGLLGQALCRQGASLSLARNNAQAQLRFAAAAEHLAACAAKDPEVYGRTYVAALNGAALTLETDDAAGAAGQLRSLSVLEALRREHPNIPELVDDHVQFSLGFAKWLCSRTRFAEARVVLAKLEPELPQITKDRARVTTEVCALEGNVAWEGHDWPRAVERRKAAVAAASAWQTEQPQRLLANEALADAFSLLGLSQNYVGNFEASTAMFRRAIEVADDMVQQFAGGPRPSTFLSRLLRSYANVLLDRARRVDLDEAAACVARAIPIDDRLALAGNVSREPRWMLLAMQAVIADARGDAKAADYWQTVESVLPKDRVESFGAGMDLLVGAQTGLSRAHFLVGDHEGATSWLGEARRCIAANKPHSDKRMVEVGWLEAQIAAARGDHLEVADIADRILAARGTWFGVRRAADCLHLAWRCAVAAKHPAAKAYAERATELYSRVMATLKQDIEQDASDPWFVLPWACACVRSAELMAADGQTAAALDLLTAALPKLEGVRAAAQADLWEEPVVSDGVQLQRRLVAEQRR